MVKQLVLQISLLTLSHAVSLSPKVHVHDAGCNDEAWLHTDFTVRA